MTTGADIETELLGFERAIGRQFTSAEREEMRVWLEASHKGAAALAESGGAFEWIKRAWDAYAKKRDQSPSTKVRETFAENPR